MAKINIDKLSIEVMRSLEIYRANTVESVEKAVLDTAKETVAELNRTSPKGATGDYAKSWNHKKDSELRGKWCRSRVVYSKKPDYRLTHLLEKGHKTVNGKNVAARPHIKRAEENAKMRLNAKLLAALRHPK